MLLQSRDFELHNPDVAARLDDSGRVLGELADHGVCGLCAIGTHNEEVKVISEAEDGANL